jgi:ATP-dependent protease Clp ATPase subunit
MAPKEKAEELVNKFIQLCGMEMTEIQCALIAVDEIQKIKSVYHDDTLYDYWEEVKQGIINL